MKQFTRDEMDEMRAGSPAPLQRRLKTADIMPSPDPEENRDDWLASRNQGIGGSDVAGILGLSPWSSPHEVWEQKTGRSDGSKDFLRLRLGRALEPFTISEFERETGLEVITFHKHTFVRRDHPWARGNMDGLVFDGRHLVGDYEGKTAGIFAKSDWEHEIPVYYQTQGQWYSWIPDFEQTFFGVLFLGRTSFEDRLLRRDDDDVREMVEASEEFWFDYVEPDKLPPADGSDAARRYRSQIYADYDKQNVELGREEFNDVLDFDRAHKRIKELEDEKELAQQRIIDHVGDKYRGVFEGCQATVIRRNLEMNVGRAAKTNPALVDKYKRTRSQVNTVKLIDLLRQDRPELLLEVADVDESKLLDNLEDDCPELVEEYTEQVEYVDTDAIKKEEWDFFIEHVNADQVNSYVRLYGTDAREAMEAFENDDDTDN